MKNIKSLYCSSQEEYQASKMLHTTSSFSITFAPGDTPNSSPSVWPPELTPLQKTNLLVIRRIFNNSETQDVFDARHQRIFTGIELYNRTNRLFSNMFRFFDMVVLNSKKRQVLAIERPFQCGICGVSLSMQPMTISDKSGAFVGSMKQILQCFGSDPVFSILNQQKKMVSGNRFLKFRRVNQFSLFKTLDGKVLLKITDVHTELRRI